MVANDRGTDLGILMFVAYRRLEQVAYDAAVAAGGVATMAQARLLARVGPEGTRLTELAAQARVTKQTAGHLVDQLERAGYVVRVPDPDDRRARLIRLTAPAEELIPVADGAVVAELERWRRHLGARAMDRLHEILDDLAEVTDPWHV